MLVEIPHLNAVESVSLHAKFKGNRTALICGERRVNWTDFNASVNAIANTLIIRSQERHDHLWWIQRQLTSKQFSCDTPLLPRHALSRSQMRSGENHV